MSQLIKRAAPGEGFDARSILTHHPELSRQRSAVIDLAYEEFCRRVDAGEQLSPGEFARGFAEVEHSLLRVLEVHEYLDGDERWQEHRASPDDLNVGDEFLGFTLTSDLGRGAFSRVFRAREIELGDRQVVVKICVQDGDEAARLGQLSHPHIVPIHSVRHDHTAGLTAICMPYLGEATLLDVLDEAFGTPGRPALGQVILKAAGGSRSQDVGGADERQPPAVGRVSEPVQVPADQAADRFGEPSYGWTLSRGSYAEAVVALGAQLCDALAYTHARGIYHCDIKPSNVLLTAAGRAMLLDFNLSTHKDAAGGRMGGTLPYMAPEQLQWLLDQAAGQREDGEWRMEDGKRQSSAILHPPSSILHPPSSVLHASPPIQPQTDLYSLGVLLYQMLTGTHPFAPIEPDKSRERAAHSLLQKQQAHTLVTGELERIVGGRAARGILACLAFDPAERPASAESLARELRRFLSLGSRLRRRLGRHRIAAGIAAFALCAAIAGSTIALASRPPLHVREYRAGLTLLDEGDYPAAAQRLTAALGSRPDFDAALLARGWSRLRASQAAGLDERSRRALLSQAYEDFQTCDRLSGTGETAASVAYCQSCMGDLPQSAAVNYEKAIARGFRNANVLNNLGYCRSRLLNAAAAVEPLEQAIQLRPNLRAAHRNLALLEQRLAGDNAGVHIRRAMGHIDTARRLGTPSPDIELEAAWIYAVAQRRFRQQLVDDFPDGFREQVIAACRSAVDRGLHPNKLNSVTTVWPELKNDSEFQSLLQQSPPRTTAASTAHLVDLFDDVRQSALHPQ